MTTISARSTGRLRPLALLLALGALVLALAPVGHGAAKANLTLTVNYFANGTINVTGPDGNPLGSTSGTPPVIPAGYYTLVLIGPGGCTELPYLIMKGPGENYLSNMFDGEVANITDSVSFLPNQTYTWQSDGVPGVIHSFATSGTLQGSAPSTPTGGNASSNHSTAVSTDPFAGPSASAHPTVSGVLSATGALTLSYKGKTVKSLPAGRYVIKITDRSKTHGVVLKSGKTTATSLTGVGYVGTHSATMHLTAGTWLFSTGQGSRALSITVG